VKLAAATLIALVLGLFLATGAESGPLPIVVVPGLQLADLTRLEKRGAVGLLVPAKGPTTDFTSAWAALERGSARNSRLGGLPRAPVRVRATVRARIPAVGPFIVLGLPIGSSEPNDARYPVAVLGRGYRGVLTSATTRIPGLVSITDIAPTARRERTRSLGFSPRVAPLDTAHALERRIASNRAAKLPATLLALGIVALLALVKRRIALHAFAPVLLANLALGAFAVTSVPTEVACIGLAALLGALLLARTLRTEAALGLVLVGVVAAYAVAMAHDPSWTALAPFGPEETGRFFGVSNILETFLLVPALAGTTLVGRRFGPGAFAAAALLAFGAVADTRLGADGGGALVLATAYAVLATRLAGRGTRTLVLALGAAFAAVAGLIAFDFATGATSHLRSAFATGLPGFEEVAAHRVPLSYERAVQQWWLVLPALLFGALAVTALRARRPPGQRALLVSLLTAVGVSLAVNDSPVDVLLVGLTAFLALERAGILAAPAAARTRSWRSARASASVASYVARVSA
jgi:hypothetical protein